MTVVAPHMPGNYGYNHRGRIARLGEQAGTYLVEVNTIAPGSLWGPVPSITPDLVVGDLVLMAQVGTTRGDLVIIGRIPGAVPDYSEVPGLVAELATKANQADLTALSSRVTGDETTIGANSSAITALQGRATTDEANIAANTSSITTLQGRATTDEANIAANTSSITALQSGAQVSYGNDYDIAGDLMRTLPRAAATSAITLANGQAFYAAMRADRAITLNSLRLLVTTAGVGGALNVSVWSGPSLAALPFRGVLPVTMSLGLQTVVFLGGGLALAAGDYYVIGLLGTGNSPTPAIAASAAVGAALLNPTTTALTSMASAATTLTSLPGTPLAFNTTTGYVPLAQIPWISSSA